MGAEANGEGTQTVEATAGSEITDTAQTVGADEAAGAQHAQVLGGNAGEDAGSAVDYEAAIAERDNKIAELEAQIKSASQSAETAEALQAKIDELKEQSASERVDFKLQLAGCRNTKAARAVLDDYDGDIDAMKAAEPWLFESTTADTTVTIMATGMSNVDTVTGGACAHVIEMLAFRLYSTVPSVRRVQHIKKTLATQSLCVKYGAFAYLI